jgi:phosphotransferase system HPr-like phosphotransfer protein
MLVRLANRFDSTTSVANEGVEVDGKSVMALIADGHGINNRWFQLQ